MVIWVDKGISDFYRSMIPKYHYPQPQMYDAHITVVRTGLEQQNIAMEHWGKHSGEEIVFQYSNVVKFDGKYFFLDVDCDRIGDIREELGLSRYRRNDNKKYHITIGNNKNCQITNSQATYRRDNDG